MNMNLIMCSLLQIGFVVIILYGTKKTDEPELMSKDNTQVMKGLACFIVMLSHLGLEEKYQIMGTLHWLAVSFFFMSSGYGLTFSYYRKPGYLNTFYKRILSIALPYVLIGIASVFTQAIDFGCGGIFFVNVILLFYAAFYLCHKLCGKYADAVMCIIIILYSISAQIFCDSVMQQREGIALYFGWGNQSIAFAWGILAAKYNDRIKRILTGYKKILQGLSFVGIGILGYLYIQTRNISQVSWTEYFIRILVFVFVIILFLIFSMHYKIGNKASFL